MNNKKSLKIVFAGTPYFAAYHLKELISSHHNITYIITQPDKPNKRGKKITLSPVKIIGKQNNIPIIQPVNINKEHIRKLYSTQSDIMIVVAYGLLLPKSILNLFPLGCINVHASLLPKWRGAAPIQWSILNGDDKTGITIIQMNEKLDSGDILHQVSCRIQKTDTTNTLIKKLCTIGSKSIINTLNNIINQDLKPIKQNLQRVTYAPKLTKKIGQINFFMTAKKIDRMVRALNPWPGVFFSVNNINIKVHESKILIFDTLKKIGTIIEINQFGLKIQTKKNIINITKIQIPSKKAVEIKDFIKYNQNIFQKDKIL